jgi:hypothetical protein
VTTLHGATRVWVGADGATPASAGKPVFLVGDPGELELVKADVSDVIPVRTELEKDGKWIDPARYGEAAAGQNGSIPKAGIHARGPDALGIFENSQPQYDWR